MNRQYYIDQACCWLESVEAFFIVGEKFSLKRLFLVVIGLWFLFALILPWIPGHGSFGDLFGSLNTLFSGFAFAGVIYAIYQQKEELKLQREELELTRGEIRGQKEQMELQNFNNHFYSLLSIHNNNTENIFHKTHKNEEITGRSFFSFVLRRIKNKIDENAQMKTNTDLQKIYLENYKFFKTILQFHFQGIRALLSVIEETDLEIDKACYVKIVRSQMAESEIQLFDLHCDACFVDLKKTLNGKYNFFVNITPISESYY